MELYLAVTARTAVVTLILALGLLAAAPVHAAQDGSARRLPDHQAGAVRPTPRLPDTGPSALAGIGVTLLAGGLALIALSCRRGAT